MGTQDSPIYIENEWSIRENRFDPVQIVTTGSNFMTGNGYLGYRGTFPDWGADQSVGCIVSDTYDNADGRWTELCNVPNALFCLLRSEDTSISLFDVSGRTGRSSCSAPPSSVSPCISNYYLSLNFRYGRTVGGFSWRDPEGRMFRVSFERFASYRNLHAVLQRIRIVSEKEGPMEIQTGIDGILWNLNGDHLHSFSASEKQGILAVESATSERDLPIAVAQGIKLSGAVSKTLISLKNPKTAMRTITADLQANEELLIEQVMSVYSGKDVQNPRAAAIELARDISGTGYDREAENSARIWDGMWNNYDIVIDSSDDTQALLHYNIYHNIIASPVHTDHLPIGARGLSCQAYQGAAFWDQEIFNLPMFLHTYPQAARNILTYRYKTLAGAKRKARRLGYDGAYYAWISGDSGDELCPDYFFKDVLTGRKIRNHFNDWQIHISMDIAYTVRQYFHATGDWDFIREAGAEILFEIANFIASRAHFRKDKNRYEFIRVLGPDEYHENADNNIFTNYQAKWSISAALEIYARIQTEEPQLLEKLQGRTDLSKERICLWEEMADLIYIPQPDPETRLIEQFDGYFQLEDIRPRQLEQRLLNPDEYWGWPNGIAFETQVIKQADVLQLFCLHPDLYDLETMKANYLYYEPRTHHRSSLSPAVHSIVAARIGFAEEAYRYFQKSLTIDLFNTNPPASGGTFIGGIHTAACGIAWQIVVSGFAGVETGKEGIICRPRLPSEWNRIQFTYMYRSQNLRFTMTENLTRIESLYSNTESVPVKMKGKLIRLEPGEVYEIPQE